MKANKVATVYAQSLLELAQEKNDPEVIRQELESLASVFVGYQGFLNFYQSPRIAQRQKIELIDKSLSAYYNSMIINLLKVLVRKRREGQILEIVEAYHGLLDDKNNRIHVWLKTAVAAEQSFISQVEKLISDKFSKQAIVHNEVDESIIGGVLLRVGDYVADISVRNELEQIRQRIISSEMRSEDIYEN